MTYLVALDSIRRAPATRTRIVVLVSAASTQVVAAAAAAAASGMVEISFMLLTIERPEGFAAFHFIGVSGEGYYTSGEW